MNSLQIGSRVSVNWPQEHTGEISVQEAIVCEQPPRSQGALVDIAFADRSTSRMRIVNWKSKLPGIVSAVGSTLLSQSEIMEKESVSRVHTTSRGLEIAVGRVVVVTNPLDANQLFAVKIDCFKQDGIVKATYCCNPSLFDHFKIDSILRELASGVDPVNFLEVVDAPNEEEDQEEEEEEDKGESVGAFYENVMYKVVYKSKWLTVKVVGMDNDSYYIRQCKADGQLFDQKKKWLVKANKIKSN